MAGICGTFCIDSSTKETEGITKMRINNVVLTSNICDNDNSPMSIEHGNLLSIMLGSGNNKCFPGKHMAMGFGKIEESSKVAGAASPVWGISGGATVFLRNGRMGGTGSSSPLSNYCKLAMLTRRLQRGVEVADVDKM